MLSASLPLAGQLSSYREEKAPWHATRCGSASHDARRFPVASIERTLDGGGSMLAADEHTSRKPIVFRAIPKP